VLFYSELLSSRCIARQREKKLKTGSGKDFLRKCLFAPVAHLDTCLPAGREHRFPKPDMYYVYALRSIKVDRIYVGITKNLKLRIKEHNSGKTKSTRFYRPWVLFYSELLSSRCIARQREKKLKTGSGKDFLRKCLFAPVAHLDRAQVS
jgi:putative endonuclease